MKSARTALLALACLVPLVASAQWQWIDKSGRKVFSDKAPPPEVTKILRQPGMKPGSSVTVEETAAAAPASPAAAAVPRLPVSL